MNIKNSTSLNVMKSKLIELVAVAVNYLLKISYIPVLVRRMG